MPFLKRWLKSFLEPLQTAWVSVITHKLRSFLTILGVVIGISAVIVLMSIGKGVTASIVSSLTSLGTNLIFVQPGSSSSGGVGQGFGSASTLTLEDADAIADNVANINAVAPYSNSSAQIVAGSYNQRVQIIGVTPSYQEVNNVALDVGEFFSQAEYDSRLKVAIIGTTVAANLFPDQDPIGQKLRMSNTVFTVVGLMTSTGTGFTSRDNLMLIPLSTFQGLLSRGTNAAGQHVVNSITVQASSKEMIPAVKADITSLLETRHKIAFDATADFSITTADDLLSTITSATQSMTLLLGAIAGISLLVGGIGVMNIMLVSVMERRREIGIRKALGARERDIWGQFLVDSALLTFSGGIIGVILGWGGSYLINRSGVIPTVVTSDVVILAVIVSVGIGLFFGFYPAWQAARLDPIQALRSE